MDPVKSVFDLGKIKKLSLTNVGGQLPIAEFNDDVFTIYYTSRNEYNQNIGYKAKFSKTFELLEDKLRMSLENHGPLVMQLV